VYVARGLGPPEETNGRRLFLISHFSNMMPGTHMSHPQLKNIFDQDYELHAELYVAAGHSRFVHSLYSKPQNHLTHFFIHIVPIYFRVLSGEGGGCTFLYRVAYFLRFLSLILC
jgi:hypothetical protein